MKTILFSLFLAFQLSSAQAAPQPFTVPSFAAQWPQVFDVEFKQTGDRIQLQWKASSESADLYYTIEKSENGTHYTTAGIVLGGFDEQQYFSYRFREKINTKAKTYYRIKQMTNDGSSRVVSEHTF